MSTKKGINEFLNFSKSTEILHWLVMTANFKTEEVENSTNGISVSSSKTYVLDMTLKSLLFTSSGSHCFYSSSKNGISVWYIWE